MRAKQVDMKQLKNCTWSLLTEKSTPGQPEDVTETTFFSVYSQLQKKLSSSMRDSLSVPLALLSILHLTNEKGLILRKHKNLTDFSIEGLLK